VSGSIDVARSAAAIYSDDNYAGLGESVAGPGDTNGDGWRDVLVSVLGADACALWFGPVEGSTYLADADARYEASEGSCSTVAGPGDADGDGHEDVVVGSIFDSTSANVAVAAFLFLGPATAGTRALAEADAILTGEAEEDLAGTSLAFVPDIDGDGRDELLVGAPNESSAGEDAGAAYLVLGGAAGTVSLADAQAKLLGEAAGSVSGSYGSSAGDTDGNGVSELLVGAPGAAGSGVVYLVPFEVD
jgi:hypothetical protein